MEKRLVQMQRQILDLKQRHDENILNLALAASWARGWMRDEVVSMWLDEHHSKYAAVLKRVARDADNSVEPGRRVKLPYDLETRKADSRMNRKR